MWRKSVRCGVLGSVYLIVQLIRMSIIAHVVCIHGDASRKSIVAYASSQPPCKIRVSIDPYAYRGNPLSYTYMPHLNLHAR